MGFSFCAPHNHLILSHLPILSEHLLWKALEVTDVQRKGVPQKRVRTHSRALSYKGRTGFDPRKTIGRPLAAEETMGFQVKEGGADISRK